LPLLRVYVELAHISFLEAKKEQTNNLY